MPDSKPQSGVVVVVNIEMVMERRVGKNGELPKRGFAVEDGLEVEETSGGGLAGSGGGGGYAAS